jgi:hypothetical protein
VNISLEQEHFDSHFHRQRNNRRHITESMSSLSALAGTITLYGGATIFIVGTLGNLLNIRLLWSTRRNSCAFLFLTSSVVNCLVLFFGLFTRILAVAFNLDWARSSLIWCKMRVAFSQSTFFISLTLVCLTSVDRVLISSRSDRLRRLSQLKTCRWTAFLTVFIWVAHAIPHLVFAELLPTSPLSNSPVICTLIPNRAFSFYQTYISLPIYLGVCPSSVLFITGLLTYRNTQQMQIQQQRQHIQKQLTSMMLLQVPLIICSTLPYVIFTEYIILTSTLVKSTDQRALESFLNHIFTLIFYVAFSCQFFVFLFCSANFRREAVQLCACVSIPISRIQPHVTMLVPTNTASTTQPH